MKKPTEAQKMEVKQIAARTGRFSTHEIIEFSKDPNTAIHYYFTNNIKEAAYKYWVEEARALIRSVQVEYNVNKVEVKLPKYTRDPEKKSNEPGYVNVENLLDDREQSLKVVQYEMKRVEAACRRAKAYATVLGTEDKVKEIEDKAQEVLDHILSTIDA